MRARLIRPEFFTDDTIGRLSHGARLLYVGTWCLADDDGYLVWNIRQIALELFGYDRGRERLTERLAGELIESGRVVVLACGRHARVPTLGRHRQKGGNLTFTVRDRHAQECESGRVQTGTDTGSTDFSVSKPLVRAIPEPDSDSDSDSDSETSTPPRGNGADPQPDVVRLQHLAGELTGRPYAMANVHGGFGAKAVDEQLVPHGYDRVEEAWRRIWSGHDGKITLRQLVLGADDELNPVPRSKPETEADQIQRAAAEMKARAARRREEANAHAE
jgi:hypothetical protein